MNESIKSFICVSLLSCFLFFSLCWKQTNQCSLIVPGDWSITPLMRWWLCLLHLSFGERVVVVFMRTTKTRLKTCCCSLICYRWDSVSKEQILVLLLSHVIWLLLILIFVCNFPLYESEPEWPLIKGFPRASFHEDSGTEAFPFFTNQFKCCCLGQRLPMILLIDWQM